MADPQVVGSDRMTLDERALTEAAKELPSHVGDQAIATGYKGFRRIIAERVVASYLAALPEPPLEDGISMDISKEHINYVKFRVSASDYGPPDERRQPSSTGFDFSYDENPAEPGDPPKIVREAARFLQERLPDHRISIQTYVGAWRDVT